MNYKEVKTNAGIIYLQEITFAQFKETPFSSWHDYNKKAPKTIPWYQKDRTVRNN
jgi:hypothetical protein